MTDKPWQHESDYYEFEEQDLPCVMVRHPETGHWCGYVGVPNTHPLYNKHYSEVVSVIDEELSRPFDITQRSIMGLLALDKASVGQNRFSIDVLFDVHGGITFAGDCPPRTDYTSDYWWFGFDCAHADDFSPYYDQDKDFQSGTYRNADYVGAQCRQLAQQLVEWWGYRETNPNTRAIGGDDA